MEPEGAVLSDGTLDVPPKDGWMVADGLILVGDEDRPPDNGVPEPELYRGAGGVLKFGAGTVFVDDAAGGELTEGAAFGITGVPDEPAGSSY